MNRGYFGIGIWYPNHECNIGTLFRSAYAFGANFVYTIGRKYKRQSSDTCNATKYIPYYNWLTKEEFINGLPKDCRLVIIEIDKKARDLNRFIHPERCVYLLGSEGGNLPLDLINNNLVVKINTNVCLNLSTCGSIVMYSRQLQYTKNE
jgi:tRNA G18 (ribose-2'-O)-methylase SpoU